MASPLLGILTNATVASSCGILLTLLLRKQFRMLFGPGLAYFLWLLVPTSLLALLLPAPSAGLKAVLGVPLAMPSLTSHVVKVSISSGQNRHPDRRWQSATVNYGGRCSNALEERRAQSSISEQVKWILKRLLAGSRPEISAVARELGLSDRTLQRRIIDDGATFRQLLLEARQELAQEYLNRPEMDVTEVVFLLGYKDSELARPVRFGGARVIAVLMVNG